MLQDIYKQHEKAFAQVSAYVILNKKHKRVATIAFKSPADGAGRLYCYLHVFNQPMARGFANGYGYDKKSAACTDAARKIVVNFDDKRDTKTEKAIKKTLLAVNAGNWDSDLARAGFTVLQAV